MKQVSVVISTYTADVSGVCSALYELGGMVVIHDPSGCNSTYNTHDEPRWYDMDSLVFISGLSEIDAIMGNDDKLISDIIRAARELNPQFIALVRTPVPMMIGTDFEAIREILEEETGLPVFYFPTNGMHSYVQGVEMALAAVAEKMVDKEVGEEDLMPDILPVNLLGVTPLDYSVNQTISSVKQYLEEKGCKIISCFAMGSTPEEIVLAGNAKVNLVVSASGLLAAKKLRERFGTPYVIGLPVGSFGRTVLDKIRAAAGTHCSLTAYETRSKNDQKQTVQSEIYLVGEPVIMQSLQEAILQEYGKNTRVVCPLEVREEILLEECIVTEGEEELAQVLKNASAVIGDPMYLPICPKKVEFFSLPHEAFSGRIYRKEIPDFSNVDFLRAFFEKERNLDDDKNNCRRK